MNNEMIDDIKDMRKALCDIEEMARNSTTFPENMDDYYKIRGLAGSAWQWSVIALGDDNELDISLTQQKEAEPVAWILTGTDRDLVPRKYLLFSGREAELHVAQNLAGGEWQSCAAKPLFLHPPKPAAQPQVPEGMILVHTELLDALDDKVRACNRTEHHHAKELLSEEAVEALDRLLSAAKEVGK